MIVKLLTEHHLEFLSLKGGCTGCSESKLAKMPHCWKSLAAAQLCLDAMNCILINILTIKGLLSYDITVLLDNVIF